MNIIAQIKAEIAAEKNLYAQLQTEFPGWSIAELKDTVGSVSLFMGSEARTVQQRAQQLGR